MKSNAVRKEDIRVEEEEEFSFAYVAPVHRWCAKFEGETPDGVEACFSRTGSTYEEALKNLTKVIENDLGWELE